MRAASGAGVLLYSSLVLAGLVDHLTMPHLLGVALMTGAASGLFAPAEISAVRAVVPKADLATALSQNQARQHVASLIGGPLGGALYAVTRWLPFAVDALTFAFSWVLLGRLRADLSPVTRPGPPRRPHKDIADGLRFTWSRPFFRVLTIWGALANLMVNALFFAATLRLIQAGFAPWQIGLVETAAGAFGLLGAVVAPWIIERMPTGRLTVTVAWSFVPLLVPLALWNHPAVVAAALAAGLFMNPAGNAGIGAYRIAVTPPELMGRVQSTSQFVSMSTMPFAPVLAGGLLAAFGGPSAMVVLGVLTGAVALIPTLSKSVREVPRPSVWRELPEPVLDPVAA
jgi:MFS family permease